MRKFRFAALMMAVLLTVTALTPAALAEEASGTETSGAAEATPTPAPVQPEEGFVCETLTEPNSKSIFMVSLDTGTVV